MTTITIQCEYRATKVCGQEPSTRCESQAITAAGRPDYNEARLLCGEHLVEELRLISRTAAFSGDDTGEMTELAKRMQQAEKDLTDLVATPNYDDNEWRRLDDIVRNARATLIAVINHI